MAMRQRHLLCLLIFLCSFVTIQAASCSAFDIDVKRKQLDSNIQKVIDLGTLSQGLAMVLTTNSLHLLKDGQMTNLNAALVRARGSEYRGSLSVDYKVPTAIYVRTGRDLWLTEDIGQTFKFINVSSDITGIDQLELHDTDKKKILLRARTKDCNSLWDCKYDLYLSTDGTSFNIIRKNVGHSIWGYQDIILTQDVRDKTKAFLSGLPDLDLMKTENNGEEWRNVLSNCVGYVTVNNTLLAVQQNGGAYSLHIARNRGEHPLKQAKIPVALPHNAYSVVSAADDEVVLHVNHGKDSYGNLYVSDKNLDNFVLSLRNNKRDSRGHSDVLRVSSIPSILLANQISPSPYDPEQATVTKISFNRGGDWQPIPAPARDSAGNYVQCGRGNGNEGCTLNLFGPNEMETYGRLVSPRKSPGILFATGTVGTEAENSLEYSKVGTYVSRDAGLSWSHVFPFSTAGTASSHGSILLAADNLKDTNTFYFSWSSGTKWSNCTFDGGLRVRSIHALGNGSDPIFMVRGEKNVGGVAVGVVAVVDFKNVHERECSTDDFENWTARTDRSDCIMGATRSFTRRKPESMCLVARSTEEQNTMTPCGCSIYDYECDYCHEKAKGSAVCVEVCAVDVNPPEDCDGTYPVTRGYRLIAGTDCDVEKGLDMRPEQIACPKKGVTPAWVTILLVMLAIFCTIIFFVAAFALFRRNERFNRFVMLATSHLPKRMVDPFRSVEFVRIEQEEETRSGLLLNDDE